MVVWAGLAPATYFVTHLADPSAAYPGDAFVVAFAWVNLVGLWGASLIAARLDALQPTLRDLLPGDSAGEPDPFRAVGSTVGPVVGTVLGSLLFEVADFVAEPGLALGLRVVPALVGQLAVFVFVWVMLATLFSLSRLGRLPLRLAPFATDTTLGLKPFGRLAFVGFAVSIVMVVPLAAATEADPRSQVVLLATVFLLAALFFVSLYRLHGQLVAAKAEHAAWARRLYAAALGPVQDAPTEETLSRQSASLLAAAELERRVGDIAEWPFDDWVLRAVVAILLGATAGIAARVVATGLGI